MVTKKSALLKDLSTAELKRLLEARKRIDVLEAERDKLAKALIKIERELARLTATGGAGPAKRKVTGRRKKTRKKSAKRGAKGKKVVRKKTARGAKSASSGRVTLEQVVLKVIKKNKGPVPFKDLKQTIVKGKLFKSKSANFDNVLRRTLSTSKLVKRVGRGIYDAA